MVNVLMMDVVDCPDHMDHPSSVDCPNLLDLPDDIIVVITGKLSPLDNTITARVCTRLRTLVHTPRPERNICAEAADHGYINILEWLHSEGYHMDDNVSRAVVINNRIDILEWLISVGCMCSSSTFEAAACCGHVKMLDLLKKVGCKIDYKTYINTLQYGRVEVIKWMYFEESYSQLAHLISDIHMVSRDGGFGKPIPNGRKLTQKEFNEIIEFGNMIYPRHVHNDFVAW